MSERMNPHFLVYAVTAEGLDAFRQRIEDAFGCKLRPSEREDLPSHAHADEEATIFGMSISVRWTHKWPNSNVYRISGGTSRRNWDASAVDFSIDDYAIRLLRGVGVDTVMTREDFSSYRKNVEGEKAV